MSAFSEGLGFRVTDAHDLMSIVREERNVTFVNVVQITGDCRVKAGVWGLGVWAFRGLGV